MVILLLLLTFVLKLVMSGLHYNKACQITFSTFQLNIWTTLLQQEKISVNGPSLSHLHAQTASNSNLSNMSSPAVSRTSKRDPFMTKALRKAIYTRTSLLNRYNKKRTQENWNAFKRQRNKCVKLLRQAKIDYYKNLDLNVLQIIGSFGKQSSHYFLKKSRLLQRLISWKTRYLLLMIEK